MKIEVSNGEMIDKYSILEIKWNKIQDEEKRIEIKKEMNELNLTQFHNIYFFSYYYKLLFYVNQKIWDLTDLFKPINIESYEYTDDLKEYIQITAEIFGLNKKRFRIKNILNQLTQSELKEQKSYSGTCCKIIIENEEIIYEKISEINYITTEYDFIQFDTPFIHIIQQIFKCPTIVYDLSIINTHEINIKTFNISNELQDTFEYEPIYYIAGGMFGDFIHQLSVINENFYKTGRKGVLFISDGNGGDYFRAGLADTYKDTYYLISSQIYIKKYQLYNNERIDINLNAWRNHPNIHIQAWGLTYSEIFGISWGKHKWITTPIDEKWKDIVLINTVDYRFADNIDFHLLTSEHNKLVFITFEVEQYYFFLSKTELNPEQVELYTAKDFTDLSIAIHSCKLFVGSRSGPMAIAYATHVPRIVGIKNGQNSNQV